MQPVQDLTLEVLRTFLEALQSEVPGLHVDEQPPNVNWNATRFQLTPPGADVSAVQVAVGSEGLDIHFGSRHVLELGARIVAEAEESLHVAQELVQWIAQRGYTEVMRVRDGRVLAAQAEFPLPSGPERFRTRGLEPLCGSATVHEVHEPG